MRIKKEQPSPKFNKLLSYTSKLTDLLLVIGLLIFSLIIIRGWTSELETTHSMFNSPLSTPIPGIILVKQTATPRPTPVLDLTFSTFTTIGEVGQLTTLTETSQEVLLSHNYANPVVFAQPSSRNETDTAVVRISHVQPDSFILYIQEAPNKDGIHSAETVSYLVLEAGKWELPNGDWLEVGLIDTAATVGRQISNQWQSVSFSDPFPTVPIVISQVQGNNDPHWVKTRQRNVTATSFQMAMEEEESKSTPHGSETLGWLAIEAGQGNWDNQPYEVAQTTNAVTHNWYQITFGQSFTQMPRWMAALNTYDGGDHAYLRFTNLSSNGVQVTVEEDTTGDSETSHTTEVVSYVAIEGDGVFTAKPR